MSYPISQPKHHIYTLKEVPASQQAAWDSFVSASPQGHLLQSWGWGELKASANWHPLRLALYDEQQSLLAAAQILRRIVPYIPSQIAHLAYIPRGPVLDWSNSDLCTAFFMHLNNYLRHQGALALRFEPNLKADETTLQSCINTLPISPARSIQPLRTIMLDLTLDETALLAQLKEKWRYNLRLAERKGVTVRVAERAEDVQAWYALMQTTSQRNQFGVHTLAYYLKAWRIFSASNSLRLYLAEYKGQLLAGIFVGLFARQGIYLYGASSNEHRNVMPNYLLQWEAIRWAKREGATCYDFWGIPETDAEEEAMAGVYRFKQGWGGEIVRFVGSYEQVYNPLAMRLIKRFVSI